MSANPKGFNVENLSNYIEVNKDIITRQMVLGDGELKGQTLSMVGKQLGIKTKERLNYLNVSPVLQDGTHCGFNPNSNDVFSEKDIEVKIAKYEDEICYSDLLGKFNEYLVKIGADASETDMPYEAEFVDMVKVGIQKEIERQFWVGNPTSANTDLIQGLVTIATTGADSGLTINSTSESGSTAYQRILDTYMSIPEEWVDEAVIFVSPSLFRSYAQCLVNKNYFNYSGENGELVDLFIPGSDVKVHKTYGLKNQDVIYATVPSNAIFGTDLMNDKETIDMWYDKTDEVLRVRCKFAMGAATLYGDAVVINTVNAGE